MAFPPGLNSFPAHAGRRAPAPPKAPHEDWARRVGLHGTHNQAAFDVTTTTMTVDVDESAGEHPCRVAVRHTTSVEHHSAEMWFPLSDLGGAKDFCCELDGGSIRGRLMEAVDEFRFLPHERGKPMAGDRLYYFHATGNDAINEALTELRRGTSVEVKFTFRTRLIPVEVAQQRWALSFMCPIAACFPRGVDDFAAKLRMQQYIRDVYAAVKEQRLRWRRHDHSQATVSIQQVNGRAIGEDCDLFVMNIECGPKVVQTWEPGSLAFLILFVIAIFVVHHLSAQDSDHRVFDTHDGL